MNNFTDHIDQNKNISETISVSPDKLNVSRNLTTIYNIVCFKTRVPSTNPLMNLKKVNKQTHFHQSYPWNHFL